MPSKSWNLANGSWLFRQTLTEAVPWTTYPVSSWSSMDSSPGYLPGHNMSRHMITGMSSNNTFIIRKRYLTTSFSDLSYKEIFWKIQSVNFQTDSLSFFQPYVMKHKKVPRPKSLRIYECHVGIATSEYRVGTYNEFTENILKRIKNQGSL